MEILMAVSYYVIVIEKTKVTDSACNLPSFSVHSDRACKV